MLQEDSTLVLYTYPLDYEIPEGLDHYHDPKIVDSLPTYQYCAVPLDKELPAVAYDILEELLIPDEDSDDNENQRRFISEEITNNLVDEALRITGNLEAEDDIDNQRQGNRWRSAGKIQVWDDNFNNYIGLHGVKVRARRWYTTHTGIANTSGNYSCNGRFRRKANYSIKWKRYDFTVRKSGSTAKYKGPKKKGNWNLNIKGGRQEYYATIFRAAHHYYYKNISGLRRPPQNSLWNTKLKIKARYETYEINGIAINGTYNNRRKFLGMGSAIHIFNPDNNSMNIYATVIHEIAHASHWNIVGKSNMKETELAVVESWARGVEWKLTNMVYPNLYFPNYYRIDTGGSVYTGVVEDMIDGIDLDPDKHDLVEGYTIREIEDVINGVMTMNKWKNNIKNSYENETEENLDALFDYWN